MNKFKRIRWSYRQRIIFKWVQYFLQRNAFPLTKREIWAYQNGPKILVNSFPKAGTNLLVSILEQQPRIVSRWTYHLDDEFPSFHSQLKSQRRGQLISLHSPYDRFWSEFLNDCCSRMIFIMRDPRDIVVSNYHYMCRDKSHRLHKFFIRLPDDKARMFAAIKGISSEDLGGQPESPSLRQHIINYKEWRTENNCLYIRFEDLVDSSGPEKVERQRNTISQIYNYAGLPFTNEVVDRAIQNVIGKGSRTFREGKPGAWRRSFDEESLALIKDECGDLLLELGYGNF